MHWQTIVALTSIHKPISYSELIRHTEESTVQRTLHPQASHSSPRGTQFFRCLYDVRLSFFALYMTNKHRVLLHGLYLQPRCLYALTANVTSLSFCLNHTNLTWFVSTFYQMFSMFDNQKFPPQFKNICWVFSSYKRNHFVTIVIYRNRKTQFHEYKKYVHFVWTMVFLYWWNK